MNHQPPPTRVPRTGLPPSVRLDEVRTGSVAVIGRLGIRSGIGKAPRRNPVRIGPTSCEGDHQAEPFHGGLDKAVLQYDAGRYAAWAAELPAIAYLLVPDAFGENLVAAGLSESTVCVGDVVQAGTALRQVSESRQPCFKLNHRFGQRDMAHRTQPRPRGARASFTACWSRGRPSQATS